MIKANFSYGTQTTLNYPIPLQQSLRLFREATLPQTELADYVLRPIQSTDLTHWCDYLQQERVKAFVSWDVKSPADLQQFVFAPGRDSMGEQIKWAICRHSDDRLIGTIGFHTIALAHHSCEIAYDLDPDYWNKGIATQICRKMTSWAHQELGFKRITASVMTENPASRRVLEKSGYNLEGLMRSYRKVRGVHKDYLLLSSISA